MRTVSQHAKPNFFLNPLNLKRMTVISLRISIVSAYKLLICLVEPFLAGLVRKVKSFGVLDKHVLGEILDSGNVTAFIN